MPLLGNAAVVYALYKGMMPGVLVASVGRIKGMMPSLTWTTRRRGEEL